MHSTTIIIVILPKYVQNKLAIGGNMMVPVPWTTRAYTTARVYDSKDTFPNHKTELKDINGALVSPDSTQSIVNAVELYVKTIVK